MICAVVYGCINVIMEFIMGTISMMIMGSGIRSGCGGSIYISSGYGDQCSLYGDRNCGSVPAGEKDLCAHGIEQDSGKIMNEQKERILLKWCIRSSSDIRIRYSYPKYLLRSPSKALP